MQNKRVAIIGAGAAGLASGRHVVAQGFHCEIYEMAAEVGGTWIYTDDIGEDKYGFPIHTAMYKDLRTNLPKEVMGFSDFPIPEQDKSFLPQKDILEFLNLYADHFKLKDLIKFEQMVVEVRRLGEEWQIKSIHKPTKEETVKNYDFVMVCNGHYNTPWSPHIEGQEIFKNTITHSHQYRSAEFYKSQKVLVIGAGFSGLDIALQMSSLAQNVVISHHNLKNQYLSQFISNIIEKPEVVRFYEEEAEFADGSRCVFDSVIFCTGYKYNFPFLHESCGVIVEDNYVCGLYKHMIHAENPSLCFIGLPFYVCAFQLFDIQARFYCQYLNGFMQLPPKAAMLEEIENDIRKRKEDGYSKKQIHMLGYRQQEYFDDLASTAKLTPIPPVICKIWNKSNDRFFENLLIFRNDKYRVVNNESFVITESLS